MLNHKTGICIDCTDGKEKLITTKRCQYHYRKYRASKWKNKEPKPRKRIKPVSKKQQKVNNDYYKEKAAYLKNLSDKTDGYPLCEARLKSCTSLAVDIHHQKGRGNNTTNSKTFLAVCRSCHTQIEHRPAWAIKEGYSLSRIKK